LEIIIISQRFANTLCRVPRGIEYPVEQLQEGTLWNSYKRVLNVLQRHFFFPKGCPISKQRGNLFVMPQKAIQFKIKVQKATNSFD
jgi:hypothetical protein